MCHIYIYNTNQHSFEQRDSNIFTGRITDSAKEINRLAETRLSALPETFLPVTTAIEIS